MCGCVHGGGKRIHMGVVFTAAATVVAATHAAALILIILILTITIIFVLIFLPTPIPSSIRNFYYHQLTQSHGGFTQTRCSRVGLLNGLDLSMT
jgi:hypothetical protein